MAVIRWLSRRLEYLVLSLAVAIIGALVAGLIAKAATNYYLDRKD